MTDEHLTGDQLAALRAHTLPPAEVLRATRHIGACPACAARARERIDARASASSLRAEATTQERRSRPVVLWSGLAAAAAIVVIVALWMRQPPPAERSPVVEAALRAGRIDQPPLLASLRIERETIRGANDGWHATLWPQGVVVVTPQPRFSWTGPNGRAVVSVYEGRTLIATSGQLQGSTWTPDKPLPRGRRYAWQVDLDDAAGVHHVIPSPPDPPAVFAIVGDASWREIEEAHRANDVLTSAVLEARAGLKSEASSDFDSYVAAHPRDARVRALANDVRRW
jgi:hypothetical protein